VAVSAQYNAFVLDLLGQVRRVSARRMFGGVGYYANERIFAIAHDDTLYFKVDEVSRQAFVAEGMKPFQPMGPQTRPMAYYAVPARLFDDADEFRLWVDRAVVVGARTWKESAR
jgi:DNA transformation protein